MKKNKHYRNRRATAFFLTRQKADETIRPICPNYCRQRKTQITTDTTRILSLGC